MSGRSTGVLVGAVIGGIAGSFIPGVGTFVGASIGASLGGIAGGLYDTANLPDSVNEQQSIADIKLQASSYGQAIPQVWGRYRLAGNIFWGTDKVEHQQRESQSASGKGGGPETVTVTKTYTISLAIGLADTRLSGPIDHIARAWRDTTLVFDEAQGQTLPDNWTFYQGTADQAPDPTIEAQEGAGNVPAYRYLAYVVMEDEDLGRSGRTYNYSFEVYQEGANNAKLGCVAVSPVTEDVWVIASELEQVWRVDPGTMERTATISLGEKTPGGQGQTLYPIAIDANSLVWALSANQNRLQIIDETVPEITQTVLLVPPVEGNTVAISNIAVTGDYAFVLMAVQGTPFAVWLLRIDPSGTVDSLELSINGLLGRLAIGDDGHIWAIALNTGSAKRIEPVGLTIEATVTGLGTPSDMTVGADGHIWVIDRAGAIAYRIDPASDTVIGTWSTGAFPLGITTASDGAIWTVDALGGVGTSTVTRIDLGTELATTYTLGQRANRISGYETFIAPDLSGGVVVLCAQSNAVVGVTSAGGVSVTQSALQPESLAVAPDGSLWAAFYDGRTLARIDEATTTLSYSISANSLSTVVTALAGAAGLSGAALDLTDLPAGNPSFALVSIQAVRASLEALAQAYRFYAVESGTALKFRTRGSGAVLTDILESSLGVGEEQRDSTSLTIRRAHDLDLPRQLAVTYTDPDQNYQQNTQRAQFDLPDGAIDTPRAITLALALSAEQAKQLAEELLREAWVQRQSFTATLGNAYAWLEPGDRITLTARGITHGLVLTETTYGRPGLLEVTARPDASFVRAAPVAVPSTSSSMGSMPSVFIPSTATPILLNLPALNAGDLIPRYVIGYLPGSTSVDGAVLYRSVDGGSTFQQIGVQSTDILTGTVATAIGAGVTQAIDDSTVITVVMDNGQALSSISDTALAAGGNLVSLGDEVLSFGTATLISAATYELTHLLRGRRGTEHAQGTHANNERLVVLDAALLSLALPIPESGVEYEYKLVSQGQSIADVDSVPLTPVASNALPFTAWNIQAEQLSGGALDDAWQITWCYRARYGGDWVEGFPNGFDTDFAGFRVRIYEDNTYAVVFRTITTYGGSTLDATATKGTIYTAAQQVEDFGSAQATLYYDVAQLTTTGASYAAEQEAP